MGKKREKRKMKDPKVILAKQMKLLRKTLVPGVKGFLVTYDAKKMSKKTFDHGTLVVDLIHLLKDHTQDKSFKFIESCWGDLKNESSPIFIESITADETSTDVDA